MFKKVTEFDHETIMKYDKAYLIAEGDLGEDKPIEHNIVNCHYTELVVQDGLSRLISVYIRDGKLLTRMGSWVDFDRWVDCGECKVYVILMSMDNLNPIILYPDLTHRKVTLDDIVECIFQSNKF